MKVHKLGEQLIRTGVITESQLREALDAQLIYGGHLGTCLIEKGSLTEEQLGRALQTISGAPYVSKDKLKSIPRYVTQSVPAKIIEKHQCVPFALEGKTIHLAMIEPNNLAVQDEIAFVTGYSVAVSICPELRVFQAMERYYDVPRRLRYVTLCQMLDASGVHGIQGLMIERFPSPAETIAVSQAGEATQAVAEPAHKVSDPRSDDSSPVFQEAAERLCRAESRQEIADIVLEAVAREMPRSMLMLLRESQAVVWRTRGLELAPDVVARATFPVTGEPLFGLMLGNLFYRGPVPDDGRYHSFYRSLGLETPQEILLLPVYLNDRLVAIFHGDYGGPAGEHSAAVSEYTRLLRKMALALNMIYLKMKIRAA